MRYSATRPPRLGDADYQTLAGFRYALRRFLAFSEQVAVSVGLTPQQYQALLAIRARGRDGLTVGDLAEQLVIQPHSAVGLADRLEARDLVRREAVPGDRRQVILRLTMRAARTLAALAQTHRDELVRLRPEVIALLEALGDDH